MSSFYNDLTTKPIPIINRKPYSVLQKPTMYISRQPTTRQRQSFAQHDFMHLSVNNPNDDFREFVDTLVVALRRVEQADNPMATIHPVLVHEGVTPISEVDAHDTR